MYFLKSAMTREDRLIERKDSIKNDLHIILYCNVFLSEEKVFYYNHMDINS